MVRQILIKPRCRRSHPNHLKGLTLIDLVDAVIDETGDDDTRLVNAVIADLMQSGKIKWVRPHTYKAAGRQV